MEKSFPTQFLSQSYHFGFAWTSTVYLEVDVKQLNLTFI